MQIFSIFYKTETLDKKYFTQFCNVFMTLGKFLKSTTTKNQKKSNCKDIKDNRRAPVKNRRFIMVVIFFKGFKGYTPIFFYDSQPLSYLA